MKSRECGFSYNNMMALAIHQYRIIYQAYRIVQAPRENRYNLSYSLKTLIGVHVDCQAISVLLLFLEQVFPGSLGIPRRLVL